nr:uncharacterized protein LOC116776085 [Danaus plexippus plexippus]
MCFKIIEFWMWRIACYVLATIFIIIGFIYGPFNTAMYFADPQPSKSELLHTEKHLAVLLLYLVGLSWYLFITHLFLLYACCMKNVKVLNVYIVLIITHLCVTIVFCVYNLFLCLIFDNQCYDHKSGSNDIAASLGVALAGVVYCVVWLVLIFARTSHDHRLLRWKIIMKIFSRAQAV